MFFSANAETFFSISANVSNPPECSQTELAVQLAAIDATLIWLFITGCCQPVGAEQNGEALFLPAASKYKSV